MARRWLRREAGDLHFSDGRRWRRGLVNALVRSPVNADIYCRHERGLCTPGDGGDAYDRRLVPERQSRPDPEGRTLVLAFGAGEARRSVIRARMTDPNSPNVPVAGWDESEGLPGRHLNGVIVLGTRKDMGKYAKQASLLLIAVPNSGADTIQDLLRRGRKHGSAIRIMPSSCVEETR